jgi:tetratricopeptide (TPR) repeat protein
MGSLYQDMGQYARALPLFEQALNICETAFGPRHMDVASSLTNIAGCYQFLRRYFSLFLPQSFLYKQ